MANVLKLKEKARALELKSQWRPALEVYQRLAEEDGEDISVWNRIGDLHLRLGEAHRAVDAYEKGVEAYADAGLLNNAIALCNKILRTAPERTIVHRRLAQFTASQGFLADARAHYLKFAERMRKLGHHEEALEALREAARHLPEDVELRRTLAGQLHASGHSEEAVEQLRSLLTGLEAQGADADAEAVREQLHAIDPRALETTIPPPAPPVAQPSEPLLTEDWRSEPQGREEQPPAEAAGDDLGIERSAAFEAADLPDTGAIEGFERVQHDDVDHGSSAAPLPLMDLQLEPLQPQAEESDPGRSPGEAWSLHREGSSFWDERSAATDDLPGLDAPEGGATADALEQLRTRLAVAPEDQAGHASLARMLREQGRSREAEALLEARHAALAEAGRFAEAAATIRTLIELREEDTELYQQQVEYAVSAGAREPLIQAYLDLAHHLTGAASAAKARVVYERVIELDPANEEARRALTPAPPPSRPGGE